MAIEWTVEHSGRFSLSGFLQAFDDTVEQLLGSRPTLLAVRGELGGQRVELSAEDARRRDDDVAASLVDLDVELEIAGEHTEFNLSVEPNSPEEGEVVGAFVHAHRTAPSEIAGFIAASTLTSHTKGHFFGSGLSRTHQWHELPALLSEITPGQSTLRENLTALAETLGRDDLGSAAG